MSNALKESNRRVMDASKELQRRVKQFIMSDRALIWLKRRFKEK